MKKRLHRMLSTMLICSMVMTMMPTTVFATNRKDAVMEEYAGGLCEHHPEHDDECGYSEGIAGTPCGFVCEINTSSILDNSLKGPKILNNDSRNLKSLVPFSLKDATMFLNGEVSDESEINDYATVIYYHEETKMIFAYSNGGENKGATEGRIKAIYYDSSDPFTPVKVVLNTDYQDNGGEGDEFQISGSELQYLFSVYGEFEVDDKVAIVWEKSGSDENATYTVVDVVGDY